jgi:hypothetical protein
MKTTNNQLCNISHERIVGAWLADKNTNFSNIEMSPILPQKTKKRKKRVNKPTVVHRISDIYAWVDFHDGKGSVLKFLPYHVQKQNGWSD